MRLVSGHPQDDYTFSFQTNFQFHILYFVSAIAYFEVLFNYIHLLVKLKSFYAGVFCGSVSQCKIGT